MAEKQSGGERVDRKAGTRTVTPRDGAPEGSPLSVTTPTGVEPGPDVSNADVDLASVSLDSNDSKVVRAPEQNPLDLRPAPGPQSVEVLGTPGDSGKS
ncbi:MAG TPA: hypothetical protein VN213_13650 [Solirubrobacteraceae bacterium]|nr:hypothetical protein [Solirubrobacteraceae bacterium]